MNEKHFFEIERKYKMLETSIEGVKYWRYIRYDFFEREIIGKVIGLNQPRQSEENLGLIITWFFNCILSRISKLFVKKNVDVLVFQHSRRIKINNVYKCPYTYKISSEYDCVKVSERRNRKYIKMCKNELFLDDLFFGASLCYYLKRIFSKRIISQIEYDLKKQLREPILEFEKIYNVKIDTESIINKTTKLIVKDRYILNYFSKMLRRVKPKVIIEVVSYAWHIMKLNEVAHRMQILTIELQHGTVIPDFVPYQYGEEGKYSHLPKYILTFSEFWNQFVKIPMNCTTVIPCGFPFFEEQISRYTHIESDEEKVTILFLSQGDIGEFLSKTAVKVVDGLKEDGYRFIYKLHPSESSEWKNMYPWLIREDIYVIDDAEKNIYEVLSMADIQIGVYSTAIFEGLGFGLKTILYGIRSDRLMEYLCEQELAEMAYSPDEIILCIRNWDRKSRNFSSEYIWKSNSKNNIFKIINQIIDKRGKCK